MNARLRRVLTARPVDLPIYRDYVIEHPKHVVTALLFLLPWSVTLGLVAALFLFGFLAGLNR